MATAEGEVEDMTSDGEWVVVEYQNWVLVNLNENHEDDEDNTGKGDDHPARCAHQEKLKGNGDATEDKDDSEDRTQHDTETSEDGVNDTLGFSDGACDDGDAAHGFLDDEAANSCSDDEGAHGFSDGTCEDAEEEDDDDDEDYVSYIDAMHDGALQDEDAHSCSDDEDDEEDGDDDDQDYEIDVMIERALQYEAEKKADSLRDAEERYYMDPVGEGRQEYMCSVQTQTRKELYVTKMMSFRGYGPDPMPFLDVSDCFNPLFESVWVPWAMDAEYCHNEDMGLLVSEAGATGLMLRQLAEEQYSSSAVPIRLLLEFMVNNAPGKKIAHIGSCSSLYWAALLQQLGAENVIVTEGPFSLTFANEAFSCIDQIGEDMFFLRNMAVGHALFFLRPPKRSSDAEPCLAERCLFCFPGDTIFFVGETGEHADNFDMAQWVEEHKLEGWRVEREMEIPCWPGSHDVFLCVTKADMRIETSN